MGWIVFWGAVVLVLAVIAYVPGWRGRRRGGPDGPNEHVLREADRGGGMISGWRNTGGGFGGGSS